VEGNHADAAKDAVPIVVSATTLPADVSAGILDLR
jgi:hypothetical protein